MWNINWREAMGVYKAEPTYLPYKYPQFEDIRSKHELLHWVTEEIDWSQDVLHWGTLMTADEKIAMERVISLFTQSDYRVGGMYLDNLIPTFANSEIRGMLTSFAGREFEHMKMYSHVGTTLGFSDSYWKEFLDSEATKAKDDMMGAEIDPAISDGIKLWKNILSEGVSLFGMFGILRSFEVRGLMLGMATGNAWSMRDEQVHTDGLIELFRVWAQENPKAITNSFKKILYNMAREVVRLEHNFIDYALLGIKVEGITEQELKDYIEFLCDRRLIEIGLKGNFKRTKDPMPWLSDLVSADASVNFFEQKPTEYSVNGMTGEYKYD